MTGTFCTWLPENPCIAGSATGIAAFRLSDQGAVNRLVFAAVPMTRQVTEEVRYPGRNVTKPHSAAAMATAATFAAGTHDRDRKQEARDYLREALDLASRSGAHELVTSLETLRRAIAV